MIIEKEPKEKIDVFFSYSHEDISFLDELQKHLKVLSRQGIISWYDRNIQAGTDWSSQIEKLFEAAQIIILLISPDFLASDYCYDVEMKRSLEKQKSGKAVVIPIVVRPSDWQSSPISKLHVLPSDGKPIVEWKDRDAAWANVVQGIKGVLTPRSWIFQGVPSRYDVADDKKVQDGLEETWLVTRYRSEIKVGDIVYFWRAGEEDKRGIYAWGKIISIPEEYENWGWGVRIKYIKRMPKHIKASTLEKNPDFAEHLLYRMPVGTNFPLTKAQAKAINEAIQHSFGDIYVPKEGI